MATSGKTNFSITAGDCMRLALQTIGVWGEGDYESEYEFGIAKQKLNLMLKDWQNFANHLWVRQKVTLILQAGQSSYEISETSQDNFTADEVAFTQLQSDIVIHSTVLDVISSDSFNANDHIGIELESGRIFWTTIVSVASINTINIADPIPEESEEGFYIFGYTNRVDSVFQVTNVLKKRWGESNEVILSYISYHEYLNLPGKDVLSEPTCWSYDRQRTKYITNFWSTPSDSMQQIILAVDRKIQDIDVSSNEFDLPQEWSNAVVLNLAVSCAPIFGKAIGDNFAVLMGQAKESLSNALANDNEQGSISIIPASRNTRGRGRI